MQKASRIARVAERAKKVKSICDAPEEVQSIVRLASLLIDIQFRHKNSKSLDWKDGRGYTRNNRGVDK